VKTRPTVHHLHALSGIYMVALVGARVHLRVNSLNRPGKPPGSPGRFSNHNGNNQAELQLSRVPFDRELDQLQAARSRLQIT
jgi:hypothetical protein